MTETLRNAAATNPDWGTRAPTTVATDRYTTVEFAEREDTCLWPHVWQMACPLGQIPQPGDFLEYEIGTRSYLVVRQSAGVVKVFHNACLHRGARLKRDCGSSPNITCSIHAWCWNLDGSLHHVVAPEDFPGLDPDSLALPECQVALWAGFVWINPDPTAMSFSEFIAPIEAQLAPYQLDEIEVRFHWAMPVDCNWKAVLDLFEEAYHVPSVHPQVLPYLDDVTTDYALFGVHSRMIMQVGQPSGWVQGCYDEDDAVRGMLEEALELGLVSEEQRPLLDQLLGNALPEGMTAREFLTMMFKAQYAERLPHITDAQWMEEWQFTVFPNTILNCSPSSVLVMRARPLGNDPDRSIFEILSLAQPAGGTAAPAAPRQWIPDPDTHPFPTVIAQDITNLPKIQAGMRMRPFLRFSGYQEMRLANRHRVIDEYLAQG